MRPVSPADVEVVARRLRRLEQECLESEALTVDVDHLGKARAEFAQVRQQAVQNGFGIVAYPPASLVDSYLSLLTRLRSLEKRLGLEWYTAAMIGACPFFMLTLLCLVPFARNILPVLAGAFFAFLFGFAVVALLLCVPSEVALAHAKEWRTRIRALEDRLSRISQLLALRSQYESAQGEYRIVLARLHDRRNQVLLRDWRSLRGTGFEAFLVEVFEMLGYKVTTTKASGDQGVDLIAAKGSLCIAIQAKGYSGSVGNSAVQEAFAGMKYYKCNHCAVITNSVFTRGATDLAARVGCRLIDGEGIPALINGKFF